MGPLSRVLVVLVVCCVLYPGPSCADPARDLWKKANAEENVYIAMLKFANVIRKYPESPLAAEAQYALGECNYLLGRTEEAHKLFKGLVDKYPGHGYSPMACYGMGMCSLEVGRYDRAMDELRRSLSVNLRGSYATLAKVGMADIYFFKREYKRALREYWWVSSRELVAPYVLYKMHICYRLLGSESHSRETGERLTRIYPVSIEAGILRHPSAFSAAIDTGGTKVVLTSPPEEGWTVQVGAFSVKENAINVVRKMRGEGCISWVHPVRIGEGMFYRVYVGKLESQIKADKMAVELTGKFDLPTLVVKIEKQ